MVTIYIITNTIDGKVYVGQTRQKLSARWAGHKYMARYGSTVPIHAAIRTYGEGVFTVATIATAPDSESDDTERMYITLLDSMNPEHGYNRSTGGMRGWTFSPITLAQLSESHKGAFPCNEVRARMAAAHKASPATAAQIARMCAGNRGRKATAEHREKIGAANRGKPKSEEWRRKISETKKAQGKKWTAEIRERTMASRARTFALRKAVD